MDAQRNPYRGTGLPEGALAPAPWPSTDSGAVARLLGHCPAAAETALVSAPALAERAGVAELWLKDERGRMGLGSFKALGAAYAIAQEAAAAGGDWARALEGRVFITASAGNHGLSVAVGARIFGARAVIVLSETVPEAFAIRLRDKGAEVVRAGAIYEDSMAEAMRLAEAEGWTLLSDSSWPGYTDAPFRIMEGYLQLAEEAVAQMAAPPTHVLLQAGVGGLAGAVAALVRTRWGDAPVVAVVEPQAAPALIGSIRAGRLVDTEGPVSAMGRLDCKTASLIALKGLARDADLFVTVSEEEAADAVAALGAEGLATTPSGGAGVAALLAGEAVERLGLGPGSRVMCILSEGPE